MSMTTACEVRHISAFIDRTPADVYAFVSDPLNLPKWAKGLSGSITQENGEWIASSPMGKVKVRFARKNDFGILDHDVELETGQVFHNPMRVVPNAEGSEVIFTLLRHPGMSETQFEEDAGLVKSDLQTLKGLLEGGNKPLH